MVSSVVEQLPLSHLAQRADPDCSIVHFSICYIFIRLFCEEVAADNAFDRVKKLALLSFQLGWPGENWLDDSGHKGGLEGLPFLDPDAFDDPEGSGLVEVVHSQ